MASNGFYFMASRKATILSKIKETADFSSLQVRINNWEYYSGSFPHSPCFVSRACFCRSINCSTYFTLGG